jgi:hypothetical protein
MFGSGYVGEATGEIDFKSIKMKLRTCTIQLSSSAPQSDHSTASNNPFCSVDTATPDGHLAQQPKVTGSKSKLVTSDLRP